MSAAATDTLWVGWLAPELSACTDDDIADDVIDFLSEVSVAEVIPERNGARVGAFVKLVTPINQKQFRAASSRQYRGRWTISVDDAQANNPNTRGRCCPRLSGPSGYCRGWNIRGHKAWQWSCSFDHPPECRPTHGASFTTDEISPGTAKYDELESEMMATSPFHNGRPSILKVERIVNRALERQYEKRRAFLTEKQGNALEREFWHGTHCKALPELLTHGLQPPSDSNASEECPVSGGKGLCTTLCGSECEHCTEPHEWSRCHMFGLGVYLADRADKSHRYVRPEVQRVSKHRLQHGGRGAVASRASGVGGTIVGLCDGRVWGRVVDEEGGVWVLNDGRIAKKHTEGVKWEWDTPHEERRTDSSDGQQYTRAEFLAFYGPDAGAKHWETCQESETVEVHSLLRCRVVLGSPFLVEGNLLTQSAMHDMCWCQDPSDRIDQVSDPWNVAKGHDSLFIRGQSGAQRVGLGVHNNEYVVFQPYQVLPMYRVDYTLQ